MTESLQSVGRICHSTIHETREFELTSGNIAFEEIDGKNFVYLSGVAAHHEYHAGQAIYVQDLSFEVLMPVDIDEFGDRHEFDFPNVDSGHIDWEKTVYSNFYENEHLLLLGVRTTITKAASKFDVEIESYVAESLERVSGSGAEIRCSYRASIGKNIDRKKMFFLEHD